MNLCVGVFIIATLVSVNGAVIGESKESEVLFSTFLVSPQSLFDVARDYHERSKLLQTDVNEVLTYTRTAVSSVLKETSGGTLEQIEENSRQIMALDNPARNAIYSLEGTLCVNNLKLLLNGITEFTGFESSNCLATYDRNVESAVKTAYDLILGYDEIYGDIHQIVVKSFIGKNAFLEAEEIEAIIKEEYNRRLSDVGDRKPDADLYINLLNASVERFNIELDNCFRNIHNHITPAYATLQGQIKTCEEFDNTPNPFYYLWSLLTTTTTVASADSETTPNPE